MPRIYNKERVIDIDRKNGYKICSKCNQKKDLNSFPLIRKRSAYKSQCRNCINIYRTKIRPRYKQKIHDYRNQPHIKEKDKQTRKIYIENNKEKIRINRKIRYKKNCEKYKEMSRQYRNLHKDRYRELNNTWYKRKYRESIKHNLDSKMCNNIRHCLKGIKNNRSWNSLVNYSEKDLEKHLQSLFTNEMTWEKFLSGDIVIDHVLPRSLFEYNSCDDIQFKICWSLENLQPLWKKDNDLKSDILPNGKRARDLSKEEKIQYLKELNLISN